MSSTENAHPANFIGRSSVPRIDLTKTLSNKKTRNKNASTPSNSRKPMGNLNRLSGTATPLGLLSPPASQTNVLAGNSDSEQNLDRGFEIGSREKELREEDPARLLISPPPEEELQQASLSRRPSFHKLSTSHLNNTIASSSTELPQPKRKRSMAPTLSFAGFSNYNQSGTVPPSGSEPQVTPNPKPRKQSRKVNRAHVRTNSGQSDVSMESLPSPSRAPRGNSSSRGDNSPSTPSRRRRQSKVLRSPHTNNPDADYIPSYRPASDEEPTDTEGWPISRKPARLSRRSATPAAIPPYEPPSVVFSSPREVVLSPVTSAAKTKRKAGSARKLKVDVQVKHEPPDIDLNAPMPPASPTDDPILLSGPPEEDLTPSRPRIMRDASVSANVPRTFVGPSSANAQPQAFAHARESLPPSSPLAQDNSSSPTYGAQWPHTAVPNFAGSSDSMELDMQPHEYAEAEGGIPYFGFETGSLPVASADAWSDSDDEDPPHTPYREPGIIAEGIGEYTGHWRMTQIRTKADPPSSATRVRIDDWGNPKSPYPRSLLQQTPRAASPNPSLLHPRPEADQDDLIFPLQEGHTATIVPPQRESHIEPQACAMIMGHPISPPASLTNEGEEEQEEQEVRDLSLPPDDEEEMVGQQDETPEGDEPTAEAEELQEEEIAEEEEVRRLSLGPEEQNAEDTQPAGHQDARVGLFKFPSTPHIASSRQVDPQSSPAPRRDLAFLSRPSDKRRSSARVSASFERAKELFGTRSSPVKPSSPLPEESDDEDQEMELAHISTQVSDVEEEEQVVDGRENVADDIDSGDESDPIVEDPGLVQITSSDPRAAARAAAILKQHDYDCYTKIVLKQQQERRRESLSHTTIEDLKKDNRRKTLADAGISKGKASVTPRRSLATVIGDKVYIPGTPVMTLGGLLEAAEKEVQLEQSRGLTPRTQNSPFSSSSEEQTLVEMALAEKATYRTPLPAKYGFGSRPRSSSANEVGGDEDEGLSVQRREWTKDEWKILDGCFTDERIQLAQTHCENLVSTMNNGDEEAPLVGVDLVDVDTVVGRFVTEMGGDEMIDAYGWSRESLRARAKAIQNKQRAGHVAPPTTPFTPRTVSKSREPRPTSMEVPSITPFGRRPFPPARKPVVLPSPAGPDAPFSNIPEDLVEQPRRRKVPATLLAPRYSHLLDEAIAVSRDFPSTEPSVESMQDDDDSLDEVSVSTLIVEPSSNDTSVSTSETSPPRKSGLGRLFSYLPSFSKTPGPSTRKPSSESKRGLPLPPAEILEKPRGPVTTPARPPVPKSKAPKDLVSLNHQPIPEKKSMIPRREPKRMKELRKVGLPEERERQQVEEAVVRPRRSSGSSVKDLINSFEANDRRASLESSNRSLTKAKSIGDLKNNGKPTWRP
ncbi:hypothetical protein GYMLUDRAFT_41334 [Collybiopsis luxurians FD-317 M1]|uniref:Uncharacterized protein n=1 Tax=Collybiopsis luxurians FD-317 M1 TaxID=944289 RepID=A0A0D0D1L0_9AGAR|nr:hypothetical protein GYMLUDRAFT_41334 [Collybiopsis luxurians FD-317 M1]